MDTAAGTVPMLATSGVTSVGRRWRTFEEMRADLRRPGFKDIAPLFQLHYQGEGAEEMAGWVWDAPHRSDDALPDPPEVWDRHFQAIWKLRTRVWPGATCEVRPAADPGWWTVTVRSPLDAKIQMVGSMLVLEMGIDRDQSPALRAAGADVRPEYRLEFPADDEAVANLSAALPRCGWLFLMLHAGPYGYGVLALNHVRIVREIPHTDKPPARYSVVARLGAAVGRTLAALPGLHYVGIRVEE